MTDKTKTKVTLQHAMTKDCTPKDLREWLKIVYTDREAQQQSYDQLKAYTQELERKVIQLKAQACSCGGSCGCKGE